MTRQPRCLDLYCGAGGAGVGYAMAGFEMWGVDLHPQPHYPYPFIQADVLSLDPRFLRAFDLIHASPPCQFGTALNNDKSRHLNLIPATRRLLVRSGALYVIENVESPKVRPFLQQPFRLCGTSFGLGAQGCELHRHRLFETNFPVLTPACDHNHAPVIGVYGGHARRRAASAGGRTTRDTWIGGHKAAAREAMQIGWMTLAEISEAIPPAYTHLIGHQAMTVLSGRLAA